MTSYMLDQKSQLFNNFYYMYIGILNSNNYSSCYRQNGIIEDFLFSVL